jgi:hypothetical protein
VALWVVRRATLPDARQPPAPGPGVLWVKVEGSPFAPPGRLLAAVDGKRMGAAEDFEVGYRAHLRALWRRDPRVFTALVGVAEWAEVVLDDGWWDDRPHTPRFVLHKALLAVRAAGRRPGGRATARGGKGA